MKTLKLTLLSFVLIFFTTTTFAQLQFGGKLGIGGATQSELGNIYNNTDISVACNAGFTVKKQFNDSFAVKCDVMYAQRGSKSSLKENGVTSDLTNNLTYLQIPVKAEFSTPVNNSKFFFATGPYAGLLLSANQETDGVSTAIKDDTNSTDIGLALELGLTKPFSKFDMVFSFNYDMGFVEISELEDDLQNKAFTFNIGVLF